jgi:hypothetical protein
LLTKIKKKMKKSLFFLAIVFLSSCLFSAEAAYNLNVVPFQGGNNLNFGRVDSNEIVNREIKIKIVSSTSSQYQIRQRILEPFTDNKGNKITSDAIKYYPLQGSNSYGSLYSTAPRRLSISENVLYTSSTGGNSDNFTVVYAVDGQKIKNSGKYRSRILYRLIPVGGTGQEQEVVLDMHLDTQRKLNVEVKTSSQSSRVLKLSTDKDQSGDINIRISGNTSQKYKITQRPETPLKNEKGEVVDFDIIKFWVSGQRGESNYPAPTGLSGKSEVIYNSSRSQEDDISVNFAINQDKLLDVASGNYSTQLIYEIETPSSLIGHKYVILQLEIKPVFDLKVDTPLTRGLYFRNLESTKTAVKKDITITVNSNLNKPYQIIQNIKEPLMNNAGQTLPINNLKVKIEKSQKERGNIDIARLGFVPCEQGDTTIFSSDSQGKAARFTVIYSLKVPPQTKPGDYFTNVSYSLIER